MLDTEPTDQTYEGRKLIDVYELTVRGLECQKFKIAGLGSLQIT